jgi:hypothetical protein
MQEMSFIFGGQDKKRAKKLKIRREIKIYNDGQTTIDR